MRTTYGYDDWSQRLTSIYTAADLGQGTEHQNREYYYSKAGDINQIDDLSWVETYFYSYDKLHRLVSETTSAKSKGVIPGIYEMAYNDSDHLHAVSSVTTRGTAYDYTYDLNGNMTDGPDLTDVMAVAQRSLTFNADNMPTSVVHPTGGTVTITYDGEAKRAKKSGPGGTTYYFSNAFEQIGATETCYVFAGNLRVAMVKDHATVTYFHKDHLGSSSVVTDENGDAQEKTRYMPFGGKRGEAAGITASNYLFTDQELDKESGLYNYDARMYDPVVGRFVSADSLVPYPNAPQSFNRYSYCVNNPLIYSDPTGHYYGGESGSDEDGHDDYDKDFGAYNDGQDISDYDKDYGYDVSRRHINPLPAGPNGPKISFINDVPTNPSPNQPVTHETAEMVESAVVDSGVKSVNINSTTGGKHSKNSRHSKGQAVDINTVNGISVKEKKNEKAVKDLQTSFNEEKNIRENFGPLINTKTSASGTRTDKPGMANSHQNHVHVSGQK